MSRKKSRQESHVRLYRHELDSEAYRSLSPDARALLVEFRALYDGRENRVYLSIREIRRRLNGIGQQRAEKARDELIDRGFIRLLTKGAFTRKQRHASEYALLNEPLEDTYGAVAPKDFMRWRKKNTVRMTSTDGTADEYRDNDSKPKKSALGTDDKYRKGSNKGTVGTDDEYTDRLPPEGGKEWLSEYMGWPCKVRRAGVGGAFNKERRILDTCCIACGVWITHGGYEFDGQFHSCNKVDKAKYRKRVRSVA